MKTFKKKRPSATHEGDYIINARYGEDDKKSHRDGRITLSRHSGGLLAPAEEDKTADGDSNNTLNKDEGKHSTSIGDKLSMHKPATMGLRF